MSLQLTQGPFKVLLVDDEENILRAIARLLMEEDLDLEVLTRHSGLHGLEALEAHPDVALILSDQRMPGMSGAEFLQKARELTPDAVRMVLTGYADMAATMDAINKGGASRYLTKPWDDELLRRAVGEGVEQYRLVLENRALTALVEKQNRELAEWNDGLKGRVLEQTATIRRQNEELKERNHAGQPLLPPDHPRLLPAHRAALSRLQEHTRNVTDLSLRAAADLGLSGGGAGDAAHRGASARHRCHRHRLGDPGQADGAMPAEELEIFLQHAVQGADRARRRGGAPGGGAPDPAPPRAVRRQGFSRPASRPASIPLGAQDHRLCRFHRPGAGGAAWRGRGKRACSPRRPGNSGRLLDPALFPVMQPHIRALYIPARSQRAEAAEKELRPKQLLHGHDRSPATSTAARVCSS